MAWCRGWNEECGCAAVVSRIPAPLPKPLQLHRHGNGPHGLLLGGGGVLVSVITASRIFLWPRLLVHMVRPLTLTVDTVQPSMLPTADTESGKSASSEYSVDMEALKVLRKIYYNLRPWPDCVAQCVPGPARVEAALAKLESLKLHGDWHTEHYIVVN